MSLDFSIEVPKDNLIQWVEFYRPKSFKEILLPKELKTFFGNIIKTKNLPNLILHSNNPGSGKTSLAHLLCNEIDYEYKYINSSKDRGIDILRDDITRFATCKSITGNMKAVILDEFDGASPDLQKALKSDIERISNVCRVIIITNEYDLIDEKLLSRFQVADMNYSSKEQYDEMLDLVAQRVLDILGHRKVGYDEDTIVDLITKHFPDIRKVINTLEEYFSKYGFINKNILTYGELNDEFIKLLKMKKLLPIRKYLKSINYNYLKIFSDIDRLIIMPNENISGEVILITCDYMKNMPKAINKEIMCAGYLQELINIL